MHDFFVSQAIPKSVRCNYQSLILRSQVIEYLDLGLSRDTDTAGNKVSNRPSHGKTGHLLILEPNAWRTLMSKVQFIRYPRWLNSSIVLDDSLCLVCKIWLVITTQLSKIKTFLPALSHIRAFVYWIIWLRNENRTRVTWISRNNWRLIKK